LADRHAIGGRLDTHGVLPDLMATPQPRLIAIDRIQNFHFKKAQDIDIDSCIFSLRNMDDEHSQGCQFCDRLLALIRMAAPIYSQMAA
jgi:hypothetical protein